MRHQLKNENIIKPNKDISVTSETHHQMKDQ